MPGLSPGPAPPGAASLDPYCCYFFERLHPLGRIVVLVPAPRLVHIGTRNMRTLRELPDVDIGVPHPHELRGVGSVEDVARVAARILWTRGEGFVVVDRRPMLLGAGEGADGSASARVDGCGGCAAAACARPAGGGRSGGG